MSQMNEDVVTSDLPAVAERAIQQYVQGLLSTETLVIQILNEVHTKHFDEINPSQRILTRFAQRICSRVLYDAWRSSVNERRNLAFSNLRRFLEWSLLHSSYAQQLQIYTHAIEDVLHSTLEILTVLTTQKNSGGPDDPAAFLKWTQTILIRQAHAYLERVRNDPSTSLDEQVELFAEQFVDLRNSDPLDEIILQEAQQTLVEALLSLRNPRYRQVLLGTYLMDLDEREVARQLGVETQDVYMWKHRALKALRQHPQILQILHTLRE